MIKCFLSNINPPGILKQDPPCPSAQPLEPTCLLPAKLKPSSRPAVAVTEAQKERTRSAPAGEENCSQRANQTATEGRHLRPHTGPGDKDKGKVPAEVASTDPAEPVEQLTRELLQSFGISADRAARKSLLEQQTRLIVNCGI